MTLIFEQSDMEGKVVAYFNGKEFLLPKDKLPSIWEETIDKPFVDQVYFDIPDNVCVYAILEYLRERPF